MKFSNMQRGITIVEIMVTLAVAAVLIGLALPAFNGFVAQRALRGQANDMTIAVQLARSESTRRGANVSVQAGNAGDDTNEWGAGGWCVMLGNGGACPADALRTFPALTSATFDGVDDLSTMTFNSRGLLVDNAARTLDLCSTDVDVDPGRQFSVSLVGRISYIDLDCHP